MTRRRTLVFVMAFGLGVATGLGAIKARRLASPLRPSPAWSHAQRRDYFARTPPRPGSAIVLGDSLVEMGPWADEIPGSANRGIGDDTTRDVLARLDALAGSRPRAVVVWVGVNDLRAGRPVAEIARDHAAILARLRADHPEARLVAIGVAPARPGVWGEPRPTNDAIASLNAALASGSAEHGAAWVDVRPLLADDRGEMRPEMTTDGLHLAPAAYVAVGEALRRIL